MIHDPLYTWLIKHAQWPRFPSTALSPVGWGILQLGIPHHAGEPGWEQKWSRKLAHRLAVLVGSWAGVVVLVLLLVWLETYDLHWSMRLLYNLRTVRFVLLLTPRKGTDQS